MLKPFQKLTLEVKKPKKELSFNKKLAWTIGMGALYIAMLNIPLLGIPRRGGATPLYVFRAITASKRGSLVELGIMPIVIAILIMHLLVALKIIKIDHSNSEEKKLYSGAVKLLSILITILFAVFFIIFDAYGELNLSTKFLIGSQLIIAGLIIVLMDELIQKGYGYGTGTSLFVLATVCFRIFDEMFNLSWDYFSFGQAWYRGAFLAFFQGIRRGDVMPTIFRKYGIPDYFGFMMMVVVIAVLIFLVSIRIEIPIKKTEEKKPDRYSIRLFYTSYVPVLLTSTLFAGIYMITNFLSRRFRFVSWFDTSIPIPTPPKAWYISIFTPPYGPEQVIERPGISIVYLFLMIVISGIFSFYWMKTAGLDSKTLVKQLISSDSNSSRSKENIETLKEYLDEYIPTTALLGGFIIGALAGLAEFLGPLGSGTGIVIMMFILQQYQKMLTEEKENHKKGNQKK